MSFHQLPIYEVAADFRHYLHTGSTLLITAPTGSGKSTQVPKWLLALIPENQRILVLQPRRLAARMLAERVAWELGESLGNTVGFQTRYERALSAQTRILFITEGILTRMLLNAPALPQIAAIVFDEFHERSLQVDLGLAMSRFSQQYLRADLRLLVMSASMETAALQEYLEGCPHLHASGRQYPVNISYRRSPSDKLYQSVNAAVAELLHANVAGDILVFMPGRAEIMQCCRSLQRQKLPERLHILPLYGGLSPAAQQQVMQSSDIRKVIVATNIAETSLTIPGVRHVIDSGLARSSRFDAARQVSSLETLPIARDSAEQRAGRAGREAEGSCCRLWSEQQQSAKAAKSIPEIQRADLAEALLAVSAFGFPDPGQFPWYETPPANNLEASLKLLEQLGLLRKNHGGLSALGEKLQHYPLHPRLALLLYYGQERGCARQAAYAAALLSERPLISKGSSDRATSRSLRQQFKEQGGELPQSDFLAAFELLQQAQQKGFDETFCRSLGIHAAAAREICRAAQHYLAMLKTKRQAPAQESDASFLKLLLQVFPDRIARRLDSGSLLCEMAARQRAELTRTSLVRNEALLLAGELREVPGSGRQAVKLELSMASGIKEEWLWELFPEQFEELDELLWDKTKQQVLRRRSLTCLGLSLEESLRNDADPEKAAAMLAAQLESNNMHLEGWDQKVENWLARVRWLSEHFPEQKLPEYNEEDLRQARLALCQGEYSYKAVRGKDCLPYVQAIMSEQQRRFVENMAPAFLPLPHGKRLKIEYVPGQQPRGKARIQELFDFKEQACVAGGRIPVLLDILAPNMRTVQITADLPRFWQVHYPGLRSALAKRYPKHEWR
ncbi:MAG: ATP-dependent helicase HrpB [Lentisphaeria bacterium]|nr:ATP-dependent helicase HrpB [Lentisphaeria bacterium]